jgi:hypothetical protein
LLEVRQLWGRAGAHRLRSLIVHGYHA